MTRYATLFLLLLLSACSGIKPIPTTPSGLNALLQYANSLQGAPYRYGGHSPQTGFDCSGFVSHVFARNGVTLPRASEDMAKQLPTLAPGAWQRGDLVFFNTNGRPYSHVGIYLGEQRFIHAASSRSGRVMVSDMTDAYWQPRFNGARRAWLKAEAASSSMTPHSPDRTDNL